MAASTATWLDISSAFAAAPDFDTVRKADFASGLVVLMEPADLELAKNWGGTVEAGNGRTDRERFPDFTDDLRHEMYEKSALFVDDLIRNDRPVRDVFFGNHTFLNVELPLHYGLGPRKIPWP